MDPRLLCWLLLQLAIQLNADVFFPEVELEGDDVVWANGTAPRIRHVASCRSRPPMYWSSVAGVMTYVLSYVEARNCRYAFSDNDNFAEYEVEVDSGTTDYDPERCPPAFSFGGRICLMNAINSDYMMIFCPQDDKNIVGYLLQIEASNTSRYMLNAVSSIRWDKYGSVSGKNFLSLVLYSIGDSVILAGNYPSMLIHVNFSESPPALAWKGGGGDDGDGDKEYLDYYEQTLQQPPLDFTNCSFIHEDENYCGYISGEDGETLVTTVTGAFNQNECLRVRRGFVHYEASAVNSSVISDDDNYGFVVEAIDPENLNVRSRRCFYTPNYKPNNLLALWTTEQSQICKYGFEMNRKRAKVSKRIAVSNTVCQTVLFPKKAKGKFRIIGMEPTQETQRGLYDLPQIAVYNGVDFAPEYIGDPWLLLRENCYVEENRVSTAFAHFIIRPIDYEHFVVICNRGYGPKHEKTEEDLKRGATAVLYKYMQFEGLPRPILQVLAHIHVQIMISVDSELRFLDNRGVFMLPTEDRKRFHFVQIMPCAHIVLDMSEEKPKFSARGPAADNRGCREEDLQTVVDEICLYRNGTLEPTHSYRPDNYYTRDILTDSSEFDNGLNGCLKSEFRAVDESDEIQYVYLFNAEKVGHRRPCFMPYRWSAGFQILSEDNSTKFCKNPFKYSGLLPIIPTTTIGPVAEVMPSSPPIHAEHYHYYKACPVYYVDNYTAVGAAGLLMFVCAAIFTTVLTAEAAGRRRYQQDLNMNVIRYTEQAAISEMTNRIPPLVSLSNEPTSTMTHEPTVTDLKTSSAYGYVYPPGFDPNAAKRSLRAVTKYSNESIVSLMVPTKDEKNNPPKVKPSAPTSLEHWTKGIPPTTSSTT